MTMTMAEPPQPRRLFLFSMPRTMSNLFMRLLSEHPQIIETQNPFMGASMHGPESVLIKSPQIKNSEGNQKLEEINKEETFQRAFDEMKKVYAEGESQGKTAIVKEHINLIIDPSHDPVSPIRRALPIPVIKIFDNDCEARKNPSILPDAFVYNLAPIILIRHPARVIPSFLRVSKAAHITAFDEWTATMMNVRYSREIFEYYRSIYGPDSAWPILIDGDDLVNNTQGVMEKLCRTIGLDESLLKYEWEKQVSTKGPVDAIFREKILNSTGVIKNEKLCKPPVIDDEFSSWKLEFGDDVAEKIRQLVDNTIEDYSWLVQYRMRADSNQL